MLTFLFWNMGGELPARTSALRVAERRARLLDIVGNLTRRYDVDLLMVAECPLDRADLLTRINTGNPTPYRDPPFSLCDRVTIYPRFASQCLTPHGTFESPTYTCRQVRLPGKKPFLLFAAHLGSKLYKSETSQTLAAPGFSSVIRKAERRARHQRTILVGDLNMNPFDPAMVGAEGLNAVMTRELAERLTREVEGRDYPFFYNPMWGHFGDASHEVWPPGHPEHEPPGTCYFKARESRWYYWNMLDQVLLRPELLPLFRNRDLKILTTDGSVSLLDARGLPDGDRVSDHLPLLFRVNI
jgi:hypothetical protein